MARTLMTPAVMVRPLVTGPLVAGALVTGALVALGAGGATAAPLLITDFPQETSGPFVHNVFHTASSHSATGGSILAWFDLNTGGNTDSYDPVTGALNLDILIFDSSAFTTQIGTATGVGTGLTAALLNGASGQVAGTITWSFSLAATSGFGTYITGLGLVLDPTNFSATLTFLSNDFATSTAGYTANSFLPQGGLQFLTLWGANGWNGTSYKTAYLGMDLVADPTNPVPEPGTLTLLAVGLLGLGLLGRRRQRQRQRQAAVARAR